MTKKLSDAERARRYADREWRPVTEYIAVQDAYLAGLRMGRKLEREKGNE